MTAVFLRSFFQVLLWGVLGWNNVAVAQISGGIRFEDATERSGVAFKHFSGGSGKHFIVETVTAGVAIFDYNNDGLQDVYLLNGAPLQGAKVQPQPRNRLYRNDGHFKFTDVTAQSNAGDTGFALGVVAGDYDNDGDQDLFVSNFGLTVLLDNEGDGTFVRREFVGPARNRIGAGIALLDIERDGNLDLFVANYVDFTFDKDVTREIYGVPAAPGPKDYDPDPDSLYQNTGDGAFVDVSDSSGISDVSGPGMGVVAFDFDEDQDTDIFVCNDSAANFLYENQGNGAFVETALLAGVAYDVTGARQASMGVDIGDFNRDGHIDMVTTNFMDEIPTLYRNSGLAYFDDVGAGAGLAVADRSVTWGVGVGDLDNDMWPDLFVASGHLLARVSQINDSEKFEAPNVVLWNDHGKRFVDQTANSRESVGIEKVSRGLALGDLNLDGLLDVVILDLNDQPQILRNLSKPAAFLTLDLVGLESNRDGVGTRVSVTIGQDTLVQELVHGRGYQGHFGTELHFGLAEAETVDSVSIHWPSGRVDAFRDVKVPGQFAVIEGFGRLLSD